MVNEGLQKSLKDLRTCHGQLNGIINMIESGRDSLEVSNQILAAQAILRRANKTVLAQYIEGCVRCAAAEPAMAEEKLKEIPPVLDKLLA